MVQGKKQLNSKPKFADVVNTFRLYNRNKRVCHKSMAHPLFCVFLYILVES